jgi:hypothetical protein
MWYFSGNCGGRGSAKCLLPHDDRRRPGGHARTPLVEKKE